MQARLDFATVTPEAVKAMLGLQAYVAQSGLEPALLELVKFRASQINGCAYCLDMHSKDARTRGETEQRLYSFFKRLVGKGLRLLRTGSRLPWHRRKNG